MIVHSKIGFHAGTGPGVTGIIEDYVRPVNKAGLVAHVKSISNAGLAVQVVEEGLSWMIDNVVIYRPAGGSIPDNPEYDADDPEWAGERYWFDYIKPKLDATPELHPYKDRIWIEVINEADKNRWDIVCGWAKRMAELMVADGWMPCLLGANAGEPETASWYSTRAIFLLNYCAGRHNVALSFHEGCLGWEDEPDMNTLVPHIITRFGRVHEVCDALGLERPTIFISEWAWTYNNMPEQSRAMSNVHDAAALYAPFLNVQGVFLWNLSGGSNWGTLPERLNAMMSDVAQFTIESEFEVDGDTPPTQPPPTQENLLINGDFEGGWYHPDGIPELQIAEGYQVDWSVEPYVVNGETITPVRPEFRVLRQADLPAHEWDLFCMGGNHGVKAFKGSGAVLFSYATKPMLIAAGSYRLTVPVYADLVMAYENGEKVFADDPMAGAARFYMGGGVGSWISLYPYGDCSDMVFDFEITEERYVSIGIELRSIWALSNSGFFTDSWSLVRTSTPIPPPTIPPPPQSCERDYSVLHILTPYSYNDTQLMEVAKWTRDGIPFLNTHGRHVMSFSVNDAIDSVKSGKVGSQLVILDGHLIYDGVTPEWMQENHPDMADRTVYHNTAAPPPTLPPPSGNVLLGVHASSDPYMTEQGIDAITVSNPGVIKVLSFHSPNDIESLKDRNPQTKLWVIRAFLSFANGRNVTPNQFFNDTISDVTRSLGALSGEAVAIELHNEPNLVDEGWGGSWGGGLTFNDWYLSVLSLYRQHLPSAKFIFPGLSPGGSIAGIRTDEMAFGQQCSSAIEASDYLGVHTYWNVGYSMSSAIAGTSRYASQFAKPVIITEASNTSIGTTPTDKAYQYIQFANDISAIGDVRAVTYFLSESSNPIWGWSVGSGETWVGTVIPSIVGGRE